MSVCESHALPVQNPGCCGFMGISLTTNRLNSLANSLFFFDSPVRNATHLHQPLVWGVVRTETLPEPQRVEEHEVRHIYQRAACVRGRGDPTVHLVARVEVEEGATAMEVGCLAHALHGAAIERELVEVEAIYGAGVLVVLRQPL